MAESSSRPLSIFLCHAQEDKPRIRELYRRLSLEEVDPWLDEIKLLPGQDWSLEIPKAVHNADLVMVCLSRNSVNKRGFVQKEISLALDAAEKQPEGSIFIIPAKLEECEIPHRLIKWQCVNLFDENGWEHLSLSFQFRSESLGLKWRNVSLPFMDVKASPTRDLTDHINNTKVFFENSVHIGDIEFVEIPEGGFLIGSRPENMLAFGWEKPQHVIEIDYKYWMARYLVTNHQYNDFVDDLNLLHPIKRWQDKPDHPVSCISWQEAIQYCHWLNSNYIESLPSNYALRLPTEVEWEKAARGVNGNEWPWGNKFEVGRCNSFESGIGDTTPVGKYSPQGDSPYGCADIAGNVWEWTHSVYRPYPYRMRDERDNEYSDVTRVLRGGSFYSNRLAIRCAFRFDYLNYLPYRGFRLALAPKLK